MNSKTCTKCGVAKFVSEFCADKRAKSGVSSRCKSCANAHTAAWQKVNLDKGRARAARWRKANPDKSRASTQKWRDSNRERHLAYKLMWNKENPEQALAWRKLNPYKLAKVTANRRARMANATPAWFSEFDEFAVEEAYELAVRRQITTGVVWSVDHVVPISGKTVCGLHIGVNLQLLPSVLNSSKGNRHDHDTFSAVRTGLFVGV